MPLFSVLYNATTIFSFLPLTALFVPSGFQNPLQNKSVLTSFLFSHYVCPCEPLPINFPQIGHLFGFPPDLFLDFPTFAVFTVRTFVTLTFALEGIFFFFFSIVHCVLHYRCIDFPVHRCTLHLHCPLPYLNQHLVLFVLS